MQMSQINGYLVTMGNVHVKVAFSQASYGKLYSNVGFFADAVFKVQVRFVLPELDPNQV